MNSTRFAALLTYELTLAVHPGGKISDRVITDQAAYDAWKAGVPVVWLAVLTGVTRMTVHRRITRSVRRSVEESKCNTESRHAPPPGGKVLV